MIRRLRVCAFAGLRVDRKPVNAKTRRRVNDMKNSTSYIFGLYGAVGIQLAVSVVAGLIIGDYIDKKIGTSPWLALAGTILGTVGGMWNLVRILRWHEKKNQNDKAH